MRSLTTRPARVRLSLLCAGLCLAAAALALPAGDATAHGLNSPKAGITSVIEFPADFVWHVIYPPDDFVDEFPAGQVTGRMVGVFSGPLLGIYRGVMGVTDLLFTPFWVMPVMSPEPRWELFEDVEYE